MENKLIIDLDAIKSTEDIFNVKKTITESLNTPDYDGVKRLYVANLLLEAAQQAYFDQINGALRQVHKRCRKATQFGPYDEFNNHIKMDGYGINIRLIRDIRLTKDPEWVRMNTELKRQSARMTQLKRVMSERVHMALNGELPIKAPKPKGLNIAVQFDDLLKYDQQEHDNYPIEANNCKNPELSEHGQTIEIEG